MIPEGTRTDYWNNEGAKVLVGKRVVRVRYLTDKEAENMGWHDRSIAIFFDDGTIIFPSQDDEGNGPGSMFGTLSGEDFTLPTLPVGMK